MTIPISILPLPETADALLRSLHTGIAEAARARGLVRQDGPVAASPPMAMRLQGIDVATPSKRDVGLLLELVGQRGVPFAVRLIVHPNDGRCFTEAEGIDPHLLIVEMPAGHPRPPAQRYYGPGHAATLASLLISAATAAG